MPIPLSTDAPCPFTCGMLPLRTGARLASVVILMIAALQLMLVLWWLDAKDVPLLKWIEELDIYVNAGLLVLAVRFFF